MKVEKLAKLFQETYRELYPQFIWLRDIDGRLKKDVSRASWEELTGDYKELMIAVAKRVLRIGKIQTLFECIDDCVVAKDFTQLKKDLLSYGKHSDRCKSHFISDAKSGSYYACDCGFEEIQQRLKQ